MTGFLFFVLLLADGLFIEYLSNGHKLDYKNPFARINDWIQTWIAKNKDGHTENGKTFADGLKKKEQKERLPEGDWIDADMRIEEAVTRLLNLKTNKAVNNLAEHKNVVELFNNLKTWHKNTLNGGWLLGILNAAYIIAYVPELSDIRDFFIAITNGVIALLSKE
jgi:hypothetical protein